LKIQKPMPLEVVAWCPGGLDRTKADPY